MTLFLLDLDHQRITPYKNTATPKNEPYPPAIQKVSKNHGIFFSSRVSKIYVEQTNEKISKNKQKTSKNKQNQTKSNTLNNFKKALFFYEV